VRGPLVVTFLAQLAFSRSAGAVSPGNSAPAEHVVDVHLDFAPLFRVTENRPWSSCAGRMHCAGLLTITLPLLPWLSLEGDLGIEFPDGVVYGGMLRSPWTFDAFGWLEFRAHSVPWSSPGTARRFG
jgi:hypothetical protein